MSRNTDNVQKTYKMKKLLRNLLFPTLLTSNFSGYGTKMLAVAIISLAGAAISNFNNECLGDDYKPGKLDIFNYVDDSSFFVRKHTTCHFSGRTEEFDRDFDKIYYPVYDPETKIVSIIPGYELYVDSRNIDSETPVNLELSLSFNSGSATINCKNELRCTIDPQHKGHDFGAQPITYWERDANDPNLFYLIANVRKEIAQNGGVIPLADLNGTYGSEEPYLSAEIRFNDYFVHLNDDDIVDFKDFAIFANNFGRTGITDTNRADPNDIGAWADYDLDGDVDANDLSIFTNYYLTGKKYHLEDGWIME